jgi:hypothetical protein
MYTLALNKGDSNTAQIIKSELDRKRSPGETDRIRREIEQKRSAEEDANEARALAAQKSQFLTGQAPTAAPATAAAPNGAASLMAPPGSPFAIERGALPSGSSFEAAPEAPPTPVLSQAQIAEMFRTEPYVTGGGRSNLGLAGLASGTYKPSTDALDAQRKDIQGRKYDTAAEYEKLGIGAASKAQEAKINKQLDELPKDKRFAAMMALSEAGFRMAGTASKPGATFLGAAAEGGTEGLKSYTASRKDIRDREERLGDKQGALAQTREDLARLAADKDEALRRGDRDQLQQIALKEAELKSEESRLSLQLRDSAANRSAMMARDQDPTRKMTSLYYQLMLNGETEKADRVLEAMTAADRRLIETDRKARAAMDREIYKNENKDNIFGNLSGLGGGGYSGYKVFGPKAGS